MENESLPHLTEEQWTALRKEALRIKARLGMEKKAAKGILHGCAPLGYKNAVVNGEKVIIIDPETSPKVRELFRLSQKRGMTIRKLIPIAAEMGLKSRNGKPLGASSIYAILRNPFYRGLIYYQRTYVKGVHESLTMKIVTN